MIWEVMIGERGSIEWSSPASGSVHTFPTMLSIVPLEVTFIRVLESLLDNADALAH